MSSSLAVISQGNRLCSPSDFQLIPIAAKAGSRLRVSGQGRGLPLTETPKAAQRQTCCFPFAASRLIPPNSNSWPPKLNRSRISQLDLVLQSVFCYTRHNRSWYIFEWVRGMGIANKNNMKNWG